jgi:DNA-binding LacI/PurR family transcriptional regulator
MVISCLRHRPGAAYKPVYPGLYTPKHRTQRPRGQMDNQDADSHRDAAVPVPPARRPTMRDVAAHAGVSKALVSLVFRNAPGASEQTRARVHQAADQLGYRHNRTASRLALRRTRLLGVTMELYNTFHAELVEELQAAAAERDYEMVVSTVTRTQDERRAVDALLDFRTEAVFLLGTELPTGTLAALARQVPVIVVGRRIASPAIDVIRTADDAGIAQAVDHLVDLGHRDIVHVDGGSGTTASDRRRGYRTAMHRHGLDDLKRIITGDYTEQAGIRAADVLLAAEQMPTGIVAVNDRCAIGVLDALLRADVDVPGSISVVGYDDSFLSRLVHLNLTTVSQEPRQQAQHAVAAAVERLDGGRTTPVNTVLLPRLVIRGTTGPPMEASARTSISSTLRVVHHNDLVLDGTHQA